MNVKKIALSVAAVVAAFAAQAQTKALPFADRSRPDHMLEVGIHAGEGLSTILQNYSKQVPGLTDLNLTPGNMNSLGVSVELPFRKYFAIGTGLDITINNYHWAMNLLDAEAGTLNSLYTSNRFYALDIPVFLDFRFNLGHNVLWTNELGMYLNYGIGGGKSKTHAFASSTNSLGQSQVTEMNYKRDYYNDADPIINGVRSSDYGLHVAMGMRFYRHFSLKAAFHLGMRNIAQNYGVLDITNRNLGLVFKVGYIF